MRARLLVAVLLAAPMSLFSQTRLASDFEIAQMRERIAGSRDFLAQLSGRLNLGDLHLTRNEIEIARDEYRRALALAGEQRLVARQNSDLTSYATATAYAGLAQAKLGRGPAAFTLFEEAIRYEADSAKTWNLYAGAMTLLGDARKGAAAARNAVAIAEEEVRRAPSAANRLDLAIYQHALSTALIAGGEDRAAESLLRGIVASLEGPEFDSLRREVAQSESFEIYSTARGEVSAYLSLLNRSQLRLAALLEKRGATDHARQTYARVLEARTDDPAALSALARLSSEAEKGRWFEEAFDANPFSRDLIREYRQSLTESSPAIAGTSAGARMRLTLLQMERGDIRAARASLDGLLQQYPRNSVLHELRRELDAPATIPAFLTSGSSAVEPTAVELRQFLALAAADQLTASQRAALDALAFTAPAIFESASPGDAGQTILERGTIDGVPFRFSGPTAFRGTFPAATPLRLEFRILGAAVSGGTSVLLIEPLGIEVQR